MARHRLRRLLHRRLSQGTRKRPHYYASGAIYSRTSVSSYPVATRLIITTATRATHRTCHGAQTIGI